MTLCYFLPITLPVISPDLGITGRLTGKITGGIIVLLTYTHDTFSINVTHFLDENE